MEAALEPTAVTPPRHRWIGATDVVNPIGDHSRGRRIVKILGSIAAAAAVLAILDAAGVDVWGWLAGLWHSLGSVSLPYLVAAIALQTVGTALTALAWLFILRAGYEHADIRFWPILAAYATGSALNAVLPANLGTLVMLFMFVAIIPGGTVAGVFAALVVEKIFFAVVGVLVYVYLFASVPGSFSLQLGGLKSHPWLLAAIVVGAALLIAGVGRLFMPKLRQQWLHAKQGGKILNTPRRYFFRVVLPSLGGYAAKLAVIGVMLAAFAIPVSFNSIMHVVAGNSIASNTAATPGGAGVTQAISVVALRDYTDPQTATAYSVAQQLVGTAWNIGLAIILLLTVFGWTNGAALVKTSYAQAKERAAERHTHAGEAEPAEAGTS
jgi:uncharacterized membrane protein YbhN (UPF0104 family)